MQHYYETGTKTGIETVSKITTKKIRNRKGEQNNGKAVFSKHKHAHNR